ncbi:hypothetical protein MPTK2_7g06230 [Marchantia polymorpha subsp. ruderalis]
MRNDDDAGDTRNYRSQLFVQARGVLVGLRLIEAPKFSPVTPKANSRTSSRVLESKHRVEGAAAAAAAAEGMCRIAVQYSSRSPRAQHGLQKNARRPDFSLNLGAAGEAPLGHQLQLSVRIRTGLHLLDLTRASFPLR